MSHPPPPPPPSLPHTPPPYPRWELSSQSSDSDLEPPSPPQQLPNSPEHATTIKNKRGAGAQSNPNKPLNRDEVLVGKPHLTNVQKSTTNVIKSPILTQHTASKSLTSNSNNYQRITSNRFNANSDEAAPTSLKQTRGSLIQSSSSSSNSNDLGIKLVNKQQTQSNCELNNKPPVLGNNAKGDLALIKPPKQNKELMTFKIIVSGYGFCGERVEATAAITKGDHLIISHWLADYAGCQGQHLANRLKHEQGETHIIIHEASLALQALAFSTKLTAYVAPRGLSNEHPWDCVDVLLPSTLIATHKNTSEVEAHRNLFSPLKTTFGEEDAGRDVRTNNGKRPKTTTKVAITPNELMLFISKYLEPNSRLVRAEGRNIYFESQSNWCGLVFYWCAPDGVLTQGPPNLAQPAYIALKAFRLGQPHTPKPLPHAKKLKIFRFEETEQPPPPPPPPAGGGGGGAAGGGGGGGRGAGGAADLPRVGTHHQGRDGPRPTTWQGCRTIKPNKANLLLWLTNKRFLMLGST